MKKGPCPFAFILLLLSLLLFANFALGENAYVSIGEMWETLPERWTGEYVVAKGDGKNLKKGDTVFVDVPIVVPEADTVPVVRITWEPPAAGLDESLEWYGNTWSYKTVCYNFPQDETAFPLLEGEHTFDPSLPWEDAPATTVQSLKKWLPFMQWAWEGPYGYFCLNDYGEECYDLSIHPLAEVAVLVKDVPLLSFDGLKAALQKQIDAGLLRGVDQLEFCYLPFLAKDGRWVLQPVWRLLGGYSGDLQKENVLPYYSGSDRDGSLTVPEEYNDYYYNAQTGELLQTYPLVREREPLPAGAVLTWENVGKEQ